MKSKLEHVWESICGEDLWVGRAGVGPCMVRAKVVGPGVVL